MKQRSLTINDRLVRYWEDGLNKQQSVILIHGLGGDHRGLIEMTAQLKDWHIIIPDLPGYGLSEPLQAEHSITNYADFLEAFRRSIGLNKFYLIGHSFGCPISLRYALDYPGYVYKLGLINPVLDSAGTIWRRLGWFYSRTAISLPPKLCKFLLSNKLVVYQSDTTVMCTKDKAIRHKILNDDYLNYNRANVRSLKESLIASNRMKLVDFKPINPDICFFVAGNHDRLVKLAQVTQQAEYLGAQLQILDGGHLLPLEQPKMVGELVSTLFKG